jgi:hypothetical protein
MSTRPPCTLIGVTEDDIVDAVRARVLEGRPTDLHGGLPLPEPVSEEAVRECESIIGYRLPPLLRRIYREIANGGIGPFSGIEGLPGGYASNGPSMLDGYLDYLRAEREPGDPPAPPRGVLFFCDFGCAMWALLDCRHPVGQMWWWEEGNRNKLNLTLPEWFNAWLVGDSYDVWARPALRLADESWSHDQADEDEESGRIVLHPDQESLW